MYVQAPLQSLELHCPMFILLKNNIIFFNYFC
jgi:hypothetical protein